VSFAWNILSLPTTYRGSTSIYHFLKEMIMAIQPTGPGSGPGQQFNPSDLANKSPQELLSMLGDPNLSADQKAAVTDALKKLLESDKAGKKDDPTNSGDKGDKKDGGDGIDDLLKKLLSGEKLDPNEKEKLKQGLMKNGLTEDQANNVIKNGEQSGGETTTAPQDIVGG
jgi:hypothetical protein